jgi:hypothetical protein
MSIVTPCEVPVDMKRVVMRCLFRNCDEQICMALKESRESSESLAEVIMDFKSRW